MTAAPPARGAVRAAFWRGRRVFLTGNTGFKGAWLSLWLAQLGAELTGFSRGAPTDPSLFALVGAGKTMQNIEGDVRDHAALARAVAAARPEVVIHMAAQPLVRRSFEDPRQTYETNVMGTVNLLDAVRLAGRDVRVVVNVTTDKCYENREWAWGYREDEQLGGHDPYASSKACSELVTSAYRRSFLDAAGTQTATARAGNVIGGGDWGVDRLVPDAMRAARAGEEVRLRNPGAIRPWQHVLNPLSGYLVLAQALWESEPESASAWNFGPPDEDARPASWIVERLGVRWVADSAPAPHEATYLKLDSSRAHQRLGWRPSVALPDALDSIADWHRALHDGEDMRAVTLSQIARLSAG